MKTRLFTILAVVMLSGVCPVKAITWTEGHHEIVDGDVYGEVYIFNDVTLDILGGSTGRLTANDTTYTNWHDGSMTRLWALDDSIINIFGGDLDFLWAAEDSLVNLCAYDVEIKTTGGFYDQGYVTGTFYSNDIPFYFDLSQDSYLHINVIPEPSSLFLLSLGGLFLRRKNKNVFRKETYSCYSLTHCNCWPVRRHRS